MWVSATLFILHECCLSCPICFLNHTPYGGVLASGLLAGKSVSRDKIKNLKKERLSEDLDSHYFKSLYRLIRAFQRAGRERVARIFGDILGVFGRRMGNIGATDREHWCDRWGAFRGAGATDWEHGATSWEGGATPWEHSDDTLGACFGRFIVYSLWFTVGWGGACGVFALVASVWYLACCQSSATVGEHCASTLFCVLATDREGFSLVRSVELGVWSWELGVRSFGG